MRRFFISVQAISQQQFKITDAAVVKHIRKVLRLQSGDAIELFDGSGQVYQATIGLLTQDEVSGIVTSQQQEDKEPWPYLTLAQALPRAGKLDDIIRMNTEVGVSEFLLLESELSVVKAGSYPAQKLLRLQKIAQEASRQSERNHIPMIQEPIRFADLLKQTADVRLIMHSRDYAGSVPINDIKPQLKSGIKTIIAVGPEGGFSNREVASAVEQGWTVVHIGLPILRTETAGVVVAGILLS